MEMTHKIEELRNYLESQNPAWSIQTAHDFDRDAETFRFDKDRRVEYVLKIPRENLDDYKVSEIVQALEQHKWKNELHRAGDRPAVFIMREGFKLLS